MRKLQLSYGLTLFLGTTLLYADVPAGGRTGSILGSKSCKRTLGNDRE